MSTPHFLSSDFSSPQSYWVLDSACVFFFECLLLHNLPQILAQFVALGSIDPSYCFDNYTFTSVLSTQHN